MNSQEKHKEKYLQESKNTDWMKLFFKYTGWIFKLNTHNGVGVGWLRYIFLSIVGSKSGKRSGNHYHLTLEAELIKLARNSPGEGDLNPALKGVKLVPRPVCLLQG